MARPERYCDMLDSIEALVQPPRRRTARLWALASRRGLIAAAGVFSIVAGGLIGAYWLGIHRTYWAGQFWCSASMGMPSWSRHATSITAVGAAIVATAALAHIASSPDEPHRRLVGTFWIASITLWILLAPMAFSSVFRTMCARSLAL